MVLDQREGAKMETCCQGDAVGTGIQRRGKPHAKVIR